MRVAISGSTGLIGSRLSADLVADGHEVVPMVRGNRRPGTIGWRTEGPLDPGMLRDVDAVVHLAGEPIGAGRWTEARKRRILQSRRQGTTTVAEAVAKASGLGGDVGPKVLVSASAIGFYGDREDEVLTEDSAPGEDFLAEVVQAWEAAAEPARDAGVRVVHPRFGIVLDDDGGALAKMLPLFRLGLGGRFGSGDQWWSWVAIDDVSAMVRWALAEESAEGAYNVTAPNPVTNEDFTEVLGAVLSRPTFATVPAFGPRLVLGELADALLFNSQRVLPERLEAAGFTFELPLLDGALRRVLA